MFFLNIPIEGVQLLCVFFHCPKVGDRMSNLGQAASSIGGPFQCNIGWTCPCLTFGHVSSSVLGYIHVYTVYVDVTNTSLLDLKISGSRNAVPFLVCL